MKANAAGEAGRSQTRHQFSLPASFHGSGDPGAQADVILALVGFILQGLAEHTQELGPYLRALVTTERFNRLVTEPACGSKRLGKGEREAAGSSRKRP